MNKSQNNSVKGSNPKIPFVSLKNLNQKTVKSTVPTLVPPVLRQVGKLAAGVAAVNTNNNAGAGSATGNPRNKCALQPGHSLMDWIRLGASGKDLTGVGQRAGNLSVTKQELLKHNKSDDAWLAIRGKVYNVTAYIPFHPGGADELLRGAGIDATNLFNEVHSWVNFEQILQKCYVGRLVAVDPSIDTAALFLGAKNPSQSPKSQRNPSNNVIKQNEEPNSIANNHIPHITLNSEAISKNTEEVKPASPVEKPRFDWIQRMDHVTCIFYSKALSNVAVELYPPLSRKSLHIRLRLSEVTCFRYELQLLEDVEWPCEMKLNTETGKIELDFRKSVGRIWESFGVLKDMSNSVNEEDRIKEELQRVEYVLRKKVQISHNSFVLKLERRDGVRCVWPIGKHVRVFSRSTDNDISRSYTPIPESTLTNLCPQISPTTINQQNELLCLLVKRYAHGLVSKYLTDDVRVDETVVCLRQPLGSFQLHRLEKREIFLLLAAGTGITPMLALMTFLLQRRLKKCQFARLLFFNKSEDDILLRSQLDDLSEHESRFHVAYILSEPDEHWRGLCGHINLAIINDCLQELLQDTGYTIQDVFICICGPPMFNSAAYDAVTTAGICSDQIHVFDG